MDSAGENGGATVLQLNRAQNETTDLPHQRVAWMPHHLVFLLFALAAMALACAEAAPVSSDMDTMDTTSDTPVSDVDCGADACIIGDSVCGGPYSTVPCVDDGSGCGVLGTPVACSLTELCEEGQCVPFENCLDSDMDGYGEGCEAGPDCNDSNASVNPGADEACDNIDNNCVDGTDEGCPDPCAGAECTIGARECTPEGNLRECQANQDGCGTWGQAVICMSGCSNASCVGCVDNDGDGRGEGCPLGPDCDDNNEDRFDGNPEVCDGIDNDCNNTADDPFTTKGDSCTAGQGACERTGSIVCTSDGSGVECDATPGTPEAERCGDNVDSDCDGDPNNGYGVIGQSCTSGSGDCQTSGSFICDPNNNTQTVCDAPPATGSPEICDGMDNNCDGTPDNGGVCTMCVDDSHEPNDSSSVGTSLTSSGSLDAVSCGSCNNYDFDWFFLGNHSPGTNISLELTHPTGTNGVGAAWADLDVEFFCNSKFCDAIRGTAGTTSGTLNGNCFDGSSCASGSRWTVHIYPRCSPGQPASGTPYTLRRF